MKSFTKAYVKYLQETPKKGGKPYSPVTIRNRSYMIDRLKEPISLESVNDFIKKNIRHQSMARAMGHFLCFHLYRKTDKATLKKIGDKLYIPPEPAKKYSHFDKVLTQEELRKLCNESSKPFNFIFRFMADTMLRKAELLSVKLEDIDFLKNQVKLEKIKGGNPDLRFFSDTTKQLLLEYLEENNIKKGLIFSQFSAYTFWYRVNQVAMKILGKKFNPHWMRSSMAQNLRDIGIDDFSLMQRGGWKDRSVLDVYSRSSIESKKRAFEKFKIEI